MTDARSGRGGAIALMAGAQWRSHWRSQAFLAGLVAVTVAVTVATMTGASRAGSAFERLRSTTNASDVAVFYDGGPDGLPPARAAVESNREVVQAGVAVELFVRPEGTEYFPDFQLLASAPRDPVDEGLDTPVIVNGRQPVPTRADEIAIGESLASELDLEPGDSLTLQSMTNDWIEESLQGLDVGPPDGPEVDVDVVGVARSPADFSRLEAVLHLTPAFVDRFGDSMRTYTILRARVTAAGLEQAAKGELDLGSADVGRSPFGDDESTDDGLGTIATALRLVAGAAALAGAVTIALTTIRLSRAVLVDADILRAVGWTRGQQVRASALVLAPWLLAGVAAGAVVGVLASPLAVHGLARAADPTPNAIRVDVLVLAGSTAVAVLGGMAVLLLGGRLATVRRDAVPHRVVQVWPLRRPVPLVIGARDALFGNVDRGGRASRAALVVGALAVALAVAAVLVSASIDRLQTDPVLTGQGTGRAIDSGESLETFDRAMGLLTGDVRVDTLAGAHVLFDITLDGERAPGTLALDLLRGDVGASLTQGRVPASSDEVALGPATLEALDKDVGDRVVLGAVGGEENGQGEGAIEVREPAEFEIVGSMLFPEGDFSHDEGVAITGDGADRVVGDVRSGGVHQVLFEWRDGVDVAQADRGIADAGMEVLTNDDTLQPATVSNLGEVVALPRFLALFVGLLGLATFAHAVSVAVRRRSSELATMRAIGITRRGTAGLLGSQAIVLGAVMLLAGVPLGLAVGRAVWRPIAEGAHVVVLAVWPWGAVGLIVGAVVVTGGTLAAFAAWNAAHLRPAALLRTE